MHSWIIFLCIRVRLQNNIFHRVDLMYYLTPYNCEINFIDYIFGYIKKFVYKTIIEDKLNILFFSYFLIKFL